MVWQLLLGVIPPQRSEWPAVLKGKREVYFQLRSEHIPGPLLAKLPCDESDSDDEAAPGSVESAGEAEESSSAVPLDPLSMPIVPKVFDWTTHSTAALAEEVTKDVRRTHQSYEFFRRSAAQSLANILYLYAKLNPGVGYVQGMNELVAPLLWAANRANSDAEAAEADCFHLFSALMMDVRDMYIRKLDSHVEGVHGVLGTFGTLLHRHEPQVAQHLSQQGIEPAFYAFRWLTALLAREFELPGTLRVWDTLFADPRRFSFLFFCCVAMVRLQRSALLAGDFVACLELLQNYPHTSIDAVLHEAQGIKAADTALAAGPRPAGPGLDPAAISDAMARVGTAMAHGLQKAAKGIKSAATLPAVSGPAARAASMHSGAGALPGTGDWGRASARSPSPAVGGGGGLLDAMAEAFRWGAGAQVPVAPRFRTAASPDRELTPHAIPGGRPSPELASQPPPAAQPKPRALPAPAPAPAKPSVTSAPIPKVDPHASTEAVCASGGLFGVSAQQTGPRGLFEEGDEEQPSTGAAPEAAAPKAAALSALLDDGGPGDMFGGDRPAPPSRGGGLFD